MRRSTPAESRGGLTIAAFVALALVAPKPTQASTLDLFSFGGRSPGLAGTGVATAGDYESLYLNPAGLASVSGMQITLGTLVGDMNLELDGNDVDNDRPLATLFAATARLRFGGALADRISIGFSALVPTAAIASSNLPLSGEPVFALLDSRAQVVSIQFGLGVRLTERLRAGFSLLGLATLGGTIFISADASDKISATSEQTLTARFSPILGAQYSLPEYALDLGLVFRTESDATFDVVVDNDLIDELPLTIPTLNLGGTAQYDPLTIALESAWRPRADLELAAQISYQRWSEFRSPTLNPVDGRMNPPSPNFSDTIVPRVSAEYRIIGENVAVDFRGGYAFVMSPAPEMSGQQSLLDNHRHLASLGAGITWPGSLPLRFDAWVQGHHLVARSHRKDASQFPAGVDPPFNLIATRGRILVGGLTLGVDL